MKSVIPPLWKHQKKTIAFASKTERMLDLSDPGTAKTRGQLEIFSKRRKAGSGCMLVLAPKNLLRSAWADDCEKYTPHLTTSIAYAENREKAFAADVDIYITNIDAVTWLAKQKPAFFKRFDMAVVDESTAYKHHTSGRSRALNKVKKHFRYRSALSGTPNSNTICDVWNQVMFLDDGRRLGTQFFAFRGTVCTPKQVGPTAQMVKWEDKEGAEEAVFDLLRDITIRHKFEDCIDIPETNKYTFSYHLPEKQLKAYREMEATQMMRLVSEANRPAAVKARMLGLPVVYDMITAINAAAVTTKLLQIASGAVYESPDKYHVVDTGRYAMIIDLVAERKHPLVFFLWKHQRDELIKEATSRKLKFCVLDGDASDKAREEMIKGYQAGFYDVMFAHPKSAAHGLTLTRGTSTIWASPTYDAEWFSQGNKRQARAGQTERTEIIVVLAPGTIELGVYEKLLTKGARMGSLLSLFAET